MEIILLIIGGVVALGLLIGITEFCVGGLSGWHKLVALLAAIAGAAVGYLDEKLPGAVGGGGLGGLAGYLLGSIFFGAVNALRLSGSVRDEAEPSRKQVSLPERIILSIFRLIAVAVMTVLTHELFWLLNAAVLVGNFGAGVAIAHVAADGGTGAALQSTAEEVRWRASVFAARPIRWCVIDDVAASNKKVLELLDSLGSQANAGEAVWQDNKPAGDQQAADAPPVNNRVLQSGAAVCYESLEKIEECFQRGWFIKHVPTDWVRKKLKPSLPEVPAAMPDGNEQKED